VIDRKYIEKAQTGELEGREIRVTAAEIAQTIEFASKILAGSHSQLFGQPAQSNQTSARPEPLA
jgi:hypothetical protein